MRITSAIVAGFAAVIISTGAFAQQNQPAAQGNDAAGAAAGGAAAGGAAAGGAAAGSAVTGKRAECRQGAADKQLRGPDRADFVQLCVAQARIDCLKQAIDQKVRGKARRDFVRSCVGGGQSQQDE